MDVKLVPIAFKQSIQGIDNLNDIGCFGLTELGYGNNAVEMETTATYDNETKEFIVNTPSPLAQKYWITNGAIHAHYCVVFASLILPDGTTEGLHGVLVLVVVHELPDEGRRRHPRGTLEDVEDTVHGLEPAGRGVAAAPLREQGREPAVQA